MNILTSNNQHPIIANVLPIMNPECLIEQIDPKQFCSSERPSRGSINSKIHRPPTPPPHLRTIISNWHRQSPMEKQRKSRPSPPSAARSFANEDGRGHRRSIASNGLEYILQPMAQILAHQAVNVGRDGSFGSSYGTRSATHIPHPQYQPPISTLASSSLNLPLSQSALRQLHQHQIFQIQQQLQLQVIELIFHTFLSVLIFIFLIILRRKWKITNCCTKHKYKHFGQRRKEEDVKGHGKKNLLLKAAKIMCSWMLIEIKNVCPFKR